jgi:hypothetical protein
MRAGSAKPLGMLLTIRKQTKFTPSHSPSHSAQPLARRLRGPSLPFSSASLLLLLLSLSLSLSTASATPPTPPTPPDPPGPCSRSSRPRERQRARPWEESGLECRRTRPRYRTITIEQRPKFENPNAQSLCIKRVYRVSDPPFIFPLRAFIFPRRQE